MYRLSKYFISLIILSPLASADCNKVFNQEALNMELGDMQTTKCGLNKEMTDNRYRISLSARSGKRGKGPSLTLHKNLEAGARMTKLLSKDPVSKHRHKYIYEFSENCSELKSISYQLGTHSTELSQEKCDNLDHQFSDQEKIYLAVSNLCAKYFPKVKKTNNGIESRSAAASSTPE